jgi:streptogramin lyase
MRTLIAIVLLLAAAYAQPSSCDLKSTGELPPDRQKDFAAVRSDTPDRAAVLFDQATAYAQAGNEAKAMSLLESALQETPWLDPSLQPEFKPLAGCPQFQQLVSAVEKKYPPVSAARVVYTVPQKDLIPEGIASDPVDGSFYMGSIYHRKIVKFSLDRPPVDFVAEGQDGLLGVLGVRVDPRDRSLWAASERKGESALFHFDRHGKTLGQYPPGTPGKHEFNDLVVTADGDVLVTDDQDGAVYRLPHGEKRLVRVDLQSRQYPNGIALAPDGKSVYVGYAYGIIWMNSDGTGLTELQKPKDVTLASVDGLYYRNGSLIAVQNGFAGNRIVQLNLGADGKSVVSGKLLEFRSANLELPTTGAIYNGKFYYMVNTQIDHEKDGEVRDPASLQPIRIAVLDLP